jgi:hypothetical protein
MAEVQEVAEQLRKDYQTVFNSEEGQRVLEDLKKTCFFYSSTIDSTPHVMGFNEGQRTAMLHIDTKLKLSVLKIKELQNERG